MRFDTFFSNSLFFNIVLHQSQQIAFGNIKPEKISQYLYSCCSIYSNIHDMILCINPVLKVVSKGIAGYSVIAKKGSNWSLQAINMGLPKFTLL